jgi:hypothetical protein
MASNPEEVINTLTADLFAMKLNYANLQLECDKLRQRNKLLIPESTNSLIKSLEDELTELKISSSSEIQSMSEKIKGLEDNRDALMSEIRSKSFVNTFVYPSIIALSSTVLLGYIISFLLKRQ